MANGIVVCGVDPGLSGGIAFVSGGRVVHADRLPVRTIDVGGRSRRMTDGDALAALLAEYRPDVVYLEEAHARTSRGRRGRDGAGSPGDSAPTAFAFGGNWAIAVDRCLAYGLEIVSPRRWQRSLLVFGSATRANTKGAAVEFVRRLHPEVDLRPGRLTEPHDGIADAACIAVYGYMQQTGPDVPPMLARRPARGRRRGAR